MATPHEVTSRGAARAARHAAAWAAVWLTAVAGCKPSFDIPATEVPRLRTEEVRTTDGRRQRVPPEWKAEVIPRQPPGKLRVGHPAERRIVTTDAVRFESPAHAGLAPLGTGLDVSQGAPVPPGPGPYGLPALWLRDEEARIVEIPLGAIDRVHVAEPGLSEGAITGIVLGSLVAVGALVGLVAGSVSLANDVGNID